MRYVSRRLATLAHMEEALAYAEEVGDIKEAAAIHAEMEKLRSYFLAGGPKTTKEQATVAYFSEHQQEARAIAAKLAEQPRIRAKYSELAKIVDRVLLDYPA
jgi:hypothetical protein